MSWCEFLSGYRAGADVVPRWYLLKVTLRDSVCNSKLRLYYNVLDQTFYQTGSDVRNRTAYSEMWTSLSLQTRYAVAN